jgi:hypothetical protein
VGPPSKGIVQTAEHSGAANAVAQAERVPRLSEWLENMSAHLFTAQHAADWAGQRRNQRHMC